MKTSIFLCSHRVYQYLAAVSGTLCIISSEMHFGWTSQSIPALTEGNYKLQISKEEASWLAITLLIGTVFGACIAGRFTDILGRKKIILSTSIPLLVGWIMIGIANSAMELFIGRFVAGIANGLSFSTVPIYLAEISEPEIRGIVASMCPVCVVIGFLVINLLGSICPINTTAYISTIFPTLLLLTFVWMPESPSFLIQRKRIPEAEKVLKLLRTEHDAKEELKRISQFLEEHQEGGLLDLLKDKTNRKGILVAYGLRTVQQFCGTTPFTFYCKTMFQESENILSASVSTMIYFSLQLIVSFIAIFLVDVFGRKPLLLFSTTGSFITLLMMTVYLFVKECDYIHSSDFQWLPLTILFLNIIFFSAGVRIVPLLMMGEMFSPRYRAKALCVGSIYFSIVSMIFVKAFFNLLDEFGLIAPFFTFTILSGASIIFIAMVVPETRGLNLEEIQEKLKRGKRQRTENQEAITAI